MVQTTVDLAHTLPPETPATGSGSLPSIEASEGHHRVGWGQALLRFVRRNKIGAAAFLVFGFFVFLAIFGPLVTSTEKVTDLTQLYSQPSRDHILGTDYAGHDTFTQIVRGTRSVLVVGALAAAMSTFFAVTLGSISANLTEGYSRSKGLDRARFFEFSLGSARESRDWYYKSRHVLSAEVIQHRMRLVTQIIAMLAPMIQHQRKNAIREEQAEYTTQPSDFSLDSEVPFP